MKHKEYNKQVTSPMNTIEKTVREKILLEMGRMLMDTPEEAARNDRYLELGWEQIPPVKLESMVTALRPRNIPRRAALNFIGYTVHEVREGGYNSAMDSYYNATPEEVKALEGMRDAILNLSDNFPDAWRIVEMKDYSLAENLKEVAETLKSHDDFLPEKRGKGRPTVEDRRFIVERCCRFWKCVTGEAPTQRPAPHKNGFPDIFLLIWKEIVGEILEDEALRKDIKLYSDALKALKK